MQYAASGPQPLPRGRLLHLRHEQHLRRSIPRGASPFTGRPRLPDAPERRSAQRAGEWARGPRRLIEHTCSPARGTQRPRAPRALDQPLTSGRHRELERPRSAASKACDPPQIARQSSGQSGQRSFCVRIARAAEVLVVLDGDVEAAAATHSSAGRPVTPPYRSGSMTYYPAAT